MTTRDVLDLLDWRRRTAQLYAEVRGRRDADPRGAHAHWVAARDALFADHPQTPLDAGARAGFRGLPHFPHDPAMVFTPVVRPLAGLGLPAGAAREPPRRGGHGG